MVVHQKKLVCHMKNRFVPQKIIVSEQIYFGPQNMTLGIRKLFCYIVCNTQIIILMIIIRYVVSLFINGYIYWTKTNTTIPYYNFLFCTINATKLHFASVRAYLKICWKQILDRAKCYVGSAFHTRRMRQQAEQNISSEAEHNISRNSIPLLIAFECTAKMNWRIIICKSCSLVYTIQSTRMQLYEAQKMKICEAQPTIFFLIWTITR